jgi:hypothetical protein
MAAVTYGRSAWEASCSDRMRAECRVGPKQRKYEGIPDAGPMHGPCEWNRKGAARTQTR